MDEERDISAELKVLTGLTDVQLVNDTYVISLTPDQVDDTRGIRRNTDSIVLLDPSFDQIPVSFLFIGDGILTQYWTLNRQIHRTNAPAYVRYNQHTKQYIAKWYHAGLLHREDGAAIIDASGFEITAKPTVHKWETCDWYWYKHGVAIPELPKVAHGTNGTVVYKDRVVSEQHIQLLHVTWDNQHAIGLYPSYMQLNDFDEIDGKRTVGNAHVMWKRRPSDGTSDTISSEAVDDMIINRYLDSINFTDGHFYNNPSNEFAMGADMQGLFDE